MRRLALLQSLLFLGLLVGTACDRSVPLAGPADGGASADLAGAGNACTAHDGVCAPAVQCPGSSQYSPYSCGGDTLCCPPPANQPDAGTLGKTCDSCSNTSCNPGQYCPNACVNCPCPGTCTAQLFVCTVGQDQTCNLNPQLSSLHGHCVAGSALGPVGSSCTCSSGFMQDPQTGKCL